MTFQQKLLEMKMERIYSKIFIIIPGVPYEMKAMIDTS